MDYVFWMEKCHTKSGTIKHNILHCGSPPVQFHFLGMLNGFRDRVIFHERKNNCRLGNGISRPDNPQKSENRMMPAISKDTDFTNKIMVIPLRNIPIEHCFDGHRLPIVLTLSQNHIPKGTRTKFSNYLKLFNRQKSSFDPKSILSRPQAPDHHRLECNLTKRLGPWDPTNLAACPPEIHPMVAWLDGQLDLHDGDNGISFRHC